jgi:ATP-dependent Lon protease
MTRDSSNKLSKKEQIKRSNKKMEQNLKKKKNETSDSEDDTGSEIDDEEMDMHEFRKYVQKIFPSKHMDKKIKAGENLKKMTEHHEDSEEEEVEEIQPKKKKNKKNKKIVEESEEEDVSDWSTQSDTEEEEDIKNKKSRKSNKKSTKKEKKNKKIEVSDDESSLSLGSEDDNEYEEEENESEEPVKQSKFNIIFTIGGAEDEEEYDDEEWDEDYEDYEDSDDVTEDEDEEVSTDESSSEEEEEIKPKKKSSKKVSKEEDEEDDIKPIKKSTKKNEDKSETKIDKNKLVTRLKEKLSKKVSKEEDDEPVELKNKPTKNIEENSDVQIEEKNDKNAILLQLKDLLTNNPKDKSIEKCIEVYEKDVKKENKKKEKKEKKQKDKNMRIFRKIIRDKNTMNDFSFYEKLETENQKKLIKELREINKITRIEKPYRMTLLESNIPIQFKAAAMKKINSLRYMEPGSGEFYKIKNWVDTFMKIPFTNYQELPISIENGVDSCHDFMENAQKTLDSAVYGLNDAKMQIMQMLGQLLTNPKAIGTAIAIHGPPGTGKTSLVKEGISKILNRPFAFIALGGATDSSFLEGHGYTYEGSSWGKIIQILIDSKCMNPVIYFDELDKISDTPRGEEIAGILTHLTDTTQNSQFHDKYFAEINFDLSKCLFIFSYNDESKINPILKDRMYRIKTKGYSGKEKTVIANNYLLPRIREQVKFTKGDIIIPDDVIGYINETHCQKEDGVRNMKRCLEIIHTKLNLYRLMRPGSNLFEGEMSLKVEFPFKVTKDIVDKLIKREHDNCSALWSMYV